MLISRRKHPGNRKPPRRVESEWSPAADPQESAQAADESHNADPSEQEKEAIIASLIDELFEIEKTSRKKTDEMNMVILMLLSIVTMGLVYLIAVSALREWPVYQSSEPMPQPPATIPPRGQRK